MNVYKLKTENFEHFNLLLEGKWFAKSVNGEKVLKRKCIIPGSDSIFVKTTR
jgi:hypothetical protein